MRERSRWLTLAMVIFSVLALLAFAACGGDDDDDDDSTGDSTPTATRDSGADGTTEPTDQPDDGGDGDSSDVFADLDELTQGLDQVTGRVTYEMNIDGDTSTMTLYSDPPNSRFDTTDSDGVSSIIITTEETTYVCDSGSETCISYPSDGGAGLGGLGLLTSFFGSGAIGVYVAAAEAAGADVDTSTEEHAGVNAQCYSWSGDFEGEESSGKFCFGGDNGVMLYEEITGSDGTTIIEATDYSSDVSDSDFEPPYDVTELPS